MSSTQEAVCAPPVLHLLDVLGLKVAKSWQQADHTLPLLAASAPAPLTSGCPQQRQPLARPAPLLSRLSSQPAVSNVLYGQPQTPQSLLSSRPGGCLPGDWLSPSVLPSIPHASWVSCLMTLLCPTDKMKLLSRGQSACPLTPQSHSRHGARGPCRQGQPAARVSPAPAHTPQDCWHRLRPVASRTR